MTDSDLTALSTLLWTIATVSLFILLAEWSSGTSWGITTGLVRGVRGWSGREATVVRSAADEAVAPITAPPRPIGGVAAARLPEAARRPEAAIADDQAQAELVELGARPIDRR